MGSGGDDVHAAAFTIEHDVAVDQRIKRVIIALTDTSAGVVLGANLANDDVSSSDSFATKLFDATALGIGVTSVTARNPAPSYVPFFLTCYQRFPEDCLISQQFSRKRGIPQEANRFRSHSEGPLFSGISMNCRQSSVFVPKSKMAARSSDFGKAAKVRYPGTVSCQMRATHDVTQWRRLIGILPLKQEREVDPSRFTGSGLLKLFQRSFKLRIAGFSLDCSLDVSLCPLQFTQVKMSLGGFVVRSSVRRGQFQ